MARPGDWIAPGGSGDHGRMRASHADREQVIGSLKAAFVQGRLDKDEFDLRVGRTFASRTYADLAAVTADLPAGLTDTEPPKAIPARSGGGRPGRIAATATVLYAAGWTCALLIPEHGRNSAALVMAYLGTVVYLCVLIVAARAAFETWHDKRSARQSRRGQGPRAGGPPLRRPPPGGQGRHYPPRDHRRWHAAEAAPRRRSQPPPHVRAYRSGRSFRPGTAPAGG
jgi:hypothetical protein